jgi:GT2 family glycosyltransferase
VTNGVSVVMPTYGRGAVAAETIAALRDIERPPCELEILVVDDGSSDADVALVEQALRGIPGARLLRQQNGGPAKARNAGFRASAGELVVFLDDDCSPAPDWLVQLIAPFAEGDEKLGAVGGRVLPAKPRNWVQRFCSAIEYATGEQPVFENASTQNSCYRRSVLEETGAFDEGFRHPGGDDPDLSTRAVGAGFRLHYAPDAVVYHDELSTYDSFVRHMYHRGLGEARMGRKYGRRRRVVARLVLAPVFLGKIAIVGWRRTAPKGRLGIRVAWATLEQFGYVAFLAGSAVGLMRER